MARSAEARSTALALTPREFPVGFLVAGDTHMLHIFVAAIVECLDLRREFVPGLALGNVAIGQKKQTVPTALTLEFHFHAL